VKRDLRGRFTSELCDICHDEGEMLCGRCNGSGEGMWSGRTCMVCKGSGGLPCECQQGDEGNLRDDEAEERRMERKGA
jgi:hypothetical protein